MLKRIVIAVIVIGAFAVWRFGMSATMPSLAAEARLAPPAGTGAVIFKSGAWACASAAFRLQVADGNHYYAHPVDPPRGGKGPAQSCRDIRAGHRYRLAKGQLPSSPCPDHSCVAIEVDPASQVLYVPNSFIAGVR